MKVANLDVALFDNETVEQMLSRFRETGLTVNLIEEVGPGGGWPSIEIIGEAEELREFLLNEICGINYGATFEQAQEMLDELYDAGCVTDF